MESLCVRMKELKPLQWDFNCKTKSSHVIILLRDTETPRIGSENQSKLPLERERLAFKDI